jgi:hypothetical protein
MCGNWLSPRCVFEFSEWQLSDIIFEPSQNIQRFGVILELLWSIFCYHFFGNVIVFRDWSTLFPSDGDVNMSASPWSTFGMGLIRISGITCMESKVWYCFLFWSDVHKQLRIHILFQKINQNRNKLEKHCNYVDIFSPMGLKVNSTMNRFTASADGTKL